MTRVAAVEPNQVTGKTKELFEQVKREFGAVPNVAKMMAHAPVVLESYLSFNATLSSGKLDRKLRECIALAVAEFDGCEYCLSAHVMLGKRAGLSEEEVSAAQQARSTDPKTEAALKFVQQVLLTRGQVTDAEVAALHQVGYSNEEVVEMVGHIAINLFTNYFNNIMQTEIDFPKAQLVSAHR